jgi:hypothetical protein
LNLGVVVFAFVQSIAGGVCAADGATALGVDLRQQGIAFCHETVIVFLCGDGIHEASCEINRAHIAPAHRVGP